MFRSTTIKLTGVYLGIIMAISLFFSANLYHLATQELNRGFRQQIAVIRQIPRLGSLLNNPNFVEERQNQLDSAEQRVFAQLFYTNLFILALGGGLSYLLARLTLKPIEEAHEAQKRFTADASHELRTPLTAMQTEIEVALRNSKLSKDQAKDLLKSNLEELAKLTTLSDGLLRLARLEINHMTMKPTPINGFIEGAIQTALPRAEAKNILIEYIQTLNLKVNGDANSLEEVLVILLDNAVKYSRPKSTIKILADIHQKQVRIAVTDQGSGIKASDLAHIFERFYRTDDSRTKNKVGGYGLGLSIAQSIVELHGGSIEATSKPGKGSIFTIKLPRAS